jgi:hypothetical protein
LVLALLNLFISNYVSSPAVAQPGDYNFDGYVGSADFTVWRDTYGLSSIPYLGADGNGDGNVDLQDYFIWKNQYVVPDLSAIAPTGGPQLSITNLGANGAGNLVWSVQIRPDIALFANSYGIPGVLGGSIAIEVGFEVVGASLASVTKNGTDFPWDNPGDSPFAFGDPPAAGVSVLGNQIFAALGSEVFATGADREVLRLETLGTQKTTISWFGAYGPNHDQCRLSQAAMNYDTSGMVMSVPEPDAFASSALGLMACLSVGCWLRRGRMPVVAHHCLAKR